MVEVSRPNFFVPKVVFVDGLGGCGKTMFSPIVSALPGVEKYVYAYDIEYVCSTYYLGKIELDAAQAMIRLMADHQIYNLMMSRETNFRPSDLSSVFKNPKKWIYFKRLFDKGGQDIPRKVIQEKPILNYTTHHLLAFSEPVCAALKDRLVFIEVVRHPLYMIKQVALNMDRLVFDLAELSICIMTGDRHVPFYTHGWEEEFLAAQPMERAILYIERLTELTEKAKEKLVPQYGLQLITVPFEQYVLSPWEFMGRISNALNSHVDATTLREMKRQRVPRKRIADGIPLDVYRHYGWEPSKQDSEQAELDDRWKLAAQAASPHYLDILKRLCERYERRHFPTTTQ